VRSTAAPYTESRLTRSVANERVGFPVVEQYVCIYVCMYVCIYFMYLSYRNAALLSWNNMTRKTEERRDGRDGEIGEGGFEGIILCLA
jgi:hypothetical protein